MNTDPRKGALDHPAPGENVEAFLACGTQDRREVKVEALSNPLDQLATISSIDPDFAQIFAGSVHTLEQQTCANWVRNRGSRNHGVLEVGP